MRWIKWTISDFKQNIKQLARQGDESVALSTETESANYIASSGLESRYSVANWSAGPGRFEPHEGLLNEGQCHALYSDTKSGEHRLSPRMPF
jgi:hypothetical protein